MKNDIEKTGKNSLTLNTFLDKMQYALLLIYFSLLYIVGNNSNLVILYYLTLGLFIVIEFAYILKAKKILVTKHILVLFLFAAVCFLTCLWAQDKELAIGRSITVTSLAISVIFIYNYCVRTRKSVDDFLLVLLIAGLFFTVYLVCYYGLNNLSGMFTSKYFRLGDGIDNSNTIGMELAITAIVAVYFGISKKKTYYLLAVPPAILSFSTASKNAFIYIILGIVMLIILSNREKLTFVVLLKKLILPVVIFVSVLFVVQSGIFPTLSSRLALFSNSVDGSGKVDLSTKTRGAYIEAGLNSFLERPFTGIGVANAGEITVEVSGAETYLHNNYVELLATTGIFGTVIYYYIFFSLILYAFKNRKAFGAPVVITMLFLGLVMDFGTVSYYHKTVYTLIVLGALFYSNSGKKVNLEKSNEKYV